MEVQHPERNRRRRPLVRRGCRGPPRPRSSKDQVFTAAIRQRSKNYYRAGILANSNGWLVDGTAGRHARIQLDFAEGLLVAGDVLLENREQRLGLLG